MTQIHQDIIGKNLDAARALGAEKEFIANRAMKQDGKAVVFSFFGEWARTKLDRNAVHDLRGEMHPSKPSALWQADSALINLAGSLSVSRISALEIPISEHSSRIEEARDTVVRDIRPYIIEKEKQEQKELLVKLESNQIRFASEKERFELLEATKERLRALAPESRQARPQYTRALKSLRNFCQVIIESMESAEEIVMKDLILNGSISFVETMMEPVETSWKGIPGRSEDLPREKPEDQTGIDRLKTISEHLNIKIEAIDAKQFKRLEKIATQPIIKEILERHESGDLPRDGSIFFFLDSDRPLLRIDACEKPKPRPGQSKESAIRHAVKTPEFLDISRLDKGIGPDGAGLFRFAEMTDRIVGAIILTPVVQDGQIVKLPGMKKPKRQVKELIGEVPECIEPTMSYGAVLNKFRPKIEKLLADKLMY
ncbi:MAG: hypothetical protein KC652_06885 [Cyanobacteria bacterium HKST-UBA01]|nr:hypothetical protein [Cyanobacteria bacterium HKST-UBA01]